MELVNRTGLAAESNLSDGYASGSQRYLMLTAKATFRFDAEGAVTLDTQDPVPLFAEDVSTPLGVLPRDSLPRADDAFEVILLGKVYAAQGSAVQRRVTLRVGEVRRELQIFGDRTWLGDDRFSPPLPFSEMPLQYERAFGGSFEVSIDAHSKLRVGDSLNARGRGFDIESYMAGLGQALRAPAGYPRVDGHVRQLPNIEYADRPIKTRRDAPPPAGWATVPPDIGLGVKWALDRVRAEQPIEQREISTRIYYRAHPDWIIALPAPAAQVEMVGVFPFERASFSLPRLRPVADVLVGAHSHVLPLVPQMLVLLPEELRFYIVYRVIAALDFRRGEERGVRLRLEPRWSAADASKAQES
jgi:hypothetical protein